MACLRFILPQVESIESVQDFGADGISPDPPTSVICHPCRDEGFSLLHGPGVSDANERPQPPATFRQPSGLNYYEAFSFQFIGQCSVLASGRVSPDATVALRLYQDFPNPVRYFVARGCVARR